MVNVGNRLLACVGQYADGLEVVQQVFHPIYLIHILGGPLGLRSILSHIQSTHRDASGIGCLGRSVKHRMVDDDLNFSIGCGHLVCRLSLEDQPATRLVLEAAIQVFEVSQPSMLQLLLKWSESDKPSLRRSLLHYGRLETWKFWTLNRGLLVELIDQEWDPEVPASMLALVRAAPSLPVLES